MGEVPVFAWVLLAAGLVLLLVAAITYFTTRAFVGSAASAEATVIVTEKPLTQEGDGNIVSAAKASICVAEFVDRRGLRQSLLLGSAVTAKLGPLDMGGSPAGKMLPAGSKIRLLFDPNNPVRARRDTFRELWLLPSAALAAGIVSLVAAAVFVLAAA